MAGSQDLYMQWYPIMVTTGATATDLVDTEVSTGLSIRGGYAWLIHKVEFHFDGWMGAAADNATQMALTVTGGFTTNVPTIDDEGVICRLSVSMPLTTSGQSFYQSPSVWRSLPPTIIANPKLYLWANAGANTSNFQSKEWVGRIGYTTVKIDNATYMEIAETFRTL